MPKPELRPEQQVARKAYKQMQRALMLLVVELGDGGVGPDSISKTLTDAMEQLEKKYGKEAVR